MLEDTPKTKNVYRLYRYPQGKIRLSETVPKFAAKIVLNSYIKMLKCKGLTDWNSYKLRPVEGKETSVVSGY